MEARSGGIDEADAAQYCGKVILLGITYVDHNGKPLDQKQWSGRIARVSNAEGIVIDLDDSDAPCSLPPDLKFLKPAKPGEYRLRSTRSVITDPDFLTTWTCKKPAPTDPRFSADPAPPCWTPDWTL